MIEILAFKIQNMALKFMNNNHSTLLHYIVGGSMTDSMIWNAMTTSMQLAQECLKEGPSSGEEQAEATPPFEGLESFAQTIESGEC